MTILIGTKDNVSLLLVLELERPAETIWPQAAIITASATSPDSALVAIGLENGIVSVWDKHLGKHGRNLKLW